MPWLEWLDRQRDSGIATKVPYRLLQPVQGQDRGASDSPNVLLEGDNLVGMKALLPYYGGQVQCCYMDPPYNTDNIFKHYDDNFEHSLWLSAMYPRLDLARRLLDETGVIFVSIDDQEGHYLKVIMDEIFGRKNFIATFIWQKVDSPNDNKPAITPDHEFILCYAKDRSKTYLRKLGDASVLDAYPHVDAADRHYRDRLVKKNGKNSLRTDRPTMWFPITAPDGTDVWPIHDDGKEARWALGKKGVQKAIKDDLLVWKKRMRGGNEVWVPYKREFAPPEPARPHPTILLDVKTSRQAKAHQKEMLPSAEQFDTVKPEQLLRRLLEVCTRPGDLVLDPYLGTGTTAAVAHKMGRRWIGIEQGDHVLTHCHPRLSMVVEGEPGGISDDVGWEGGGGFRFYRLGSPVFDENGHLHHGIPFAHLAAHVWHIETGTARSTRLMKSPLLGIHEGTAYYLLYNGVLGDKRPDGGNVLTLKLLGDLPEHDGPKVIYGEATRLGAERLKSLGITFRQTPYDLKAR